MGIDSGYSHSPRAIGGVPLYAGCWRSVDINLHAAFINMSAEGPNQEAGTNPL